MDYDPILDNSNLNHKVLRGFLRKYKEKPNPFQRKLIIKYYLLFIEKGRREGL